MTHQPTDFTIAPGRWTLVFLCYERKKKKTRPREAKGLARGPAASWWQSPRSSPTCLTLEPPGWSHVTREHAPHPDGFLSLGVCGPAPWEAADTEFLFLPWTQRLPLLCGGAKAQQTQVMVMVMP